MGRILSLLFVSMVSLSAVEISQEKGLEPFSLSHGLEVWTKNIEHSSQVACRYVGQDLLHGKPQIIALDCPAGVFEEDLPSFLNCCEEEVSEKGGIPIGLVVVGAVNREGLHHFLANRYSEDNTTSEYSCDDVQLIPNQNSKEIDVLISYPTSFSPIKTDADLKKLWTFYLIQSMAENRFKNATIDADGKWIQNEQNKYLLPATTTVGHGVEKYWSPADTEDKLLKSYLTAVQVLKERGFTKNELADSQTQLIKHINRFNDSDPDEIKLAEYYASHLAASLPCADYEKFMEHSLRVVSEITMQDVSEMLKASFGDDTRQVVIRYPMGSSLTAETVQASLKQFKSDGLEFNYADLIVDGKDPFSQLPITDEEQKMVREIIQVVGETGKLALWNMKSELDEKKVKLSKIHPLRSIAAIMTDSYTKKCMAEIMGDTLKRMSFMSDYTARLNREFDRGNINMYVQGFCLSVKANSDQVRAYINAKQWEKLIKYLIKLNN
jgi:hypothetical protein